MPAVFVWFLRVEKFLLSVDKDYRIFEIPKVS
jgi:hypothetical protein